jgi:hypothetical protein
MRIICYKGEDILIFNLEINEKCELKEKGPIPTLGQAL